MHLSEIGSTEVTQAVVPLGAVWPHFTWWYYRVLDPLANRALMRYNRLFGTTALRSFWFLVSGLIKPEPMHFGLKLSLIIGRTAFEKRSYRSAVVPIFKRQYRFLKGSTYFTESMSFRRFWKPYDRLYRSSVRYDRAMRLYRALVGGRTARGFSTAMSE